MDLRGPHRPRPLGVPGPGLLNGDDTSEVFFFYGTLRAGQPPPAWAAWLEPLPRHPATLPGRLLDLGAYPGALPGPESGAGAGPAIVGELVAVPRERVPELDRYEGFAPEDPGASLFVRERARATAAGGERVACWVYRFAGADAAPDVAGGDWLARRGPR
ncbi:MAG TPA: gamma-glutamylcyclotransferase family protein [Myxococcota bacterium]|nr:gamma-glutamylcyclotransferase family protein [Myxococcota bacterium]